MPANAFDILSKLKLSPIWKGEEQIPIHNSIFAFFPAKPSSFFGCYISVLDRMEKQAFQPVCILESSRSFDWSLGAEEIIPEAFELTGPWLILHFAISNNAHMVGNSKSWLIVPRYNMCLSSKINSARFWQIPPPPLWPGQPAISSTSWRLTMADFWTDSFRSGKGGGRQTFRKISVIWYFI